MIGFKICKTCALSFRNRATDFQYNSVLFLHDREFGSNPFQPNVAFHIEIDLHSKSNDWFHYEVQHQT